MCDFICLEQSYRFLPANRRTTRHLLAFTVRLMRMSPEINSVQLNSKDLLTNRRVAAHFVAQSFGWSVIFSRISSILKITVLSSVFYVGSSAVPIARLLILLRMTEQIRDEGSLLTNGLTLFILLHFHVANCPILVGLFNFTINFCSCLR
jgi:hypothetical protein